MCTPKFSIVIPLYNKENYIKRAIQSVLDQSVQDFELIVVNDGSSDGSLKIAKSFISDKIAIIDKMNGGESSARNEGIKMARGEYICFLDGDDEFTNDHLETLKTSIIKNPNERFFSTNSYDKYPGKEDLVPAFENVNLISRIENYFVDCQIRSYVTSNTACIHRKVFEEVGLFDENLIFGPDLEMWFRVALEYDLIFNHHPTAIYHREAENRVMQKMIKFNGVFIEKLYENIKDKLPNSKERLYVEGKLIQECKRLLRNGNNKEVRKQIIHFNHLFQNKFIFLKMMIFTLLPIKYIVSIKSSTK